MALKTILITQARISSKRLPGKVLMKINNQTLLKIHLDRLKNCKNIDEIIVATTLNSVDIEIFNKSKSWGFESFRGSENDVLDRFYQAVKIDEPEWIVRVTSDCPLIDPKLIDDVILFVKSKNVDYGSNILIENYPDGQDIEVFKFKALKKAWKNAKLLSEREHVTPFIINNSDFKGGTLFKAINYPCEKDYSSLRMTVDERLDFKLIKALINDMGTKKTWLEYAKYIKENSLFKINENILRNEGLLSSLKNDRNG